MSIFLLALFVLRVHLPSPVCGDVGSDQLLSQECRSRAVGVSLYLEDAVSVSEVGIAGCMQNVCISESSKKIRRIFVARELLW